VVGFDSIIPPGRTGKLTPKVNIKNSHGGQIRKSVTITSNAANSPSLNIFIGANIKPVIGISTSFLRVVTGKDQKGEKIVLTTAKSDLKIEQVEFKSGPVGGPAASPAWQSDLPAFVTYAMVRRPQANADGLYEYELELSLSGGDGQRRYGEFVIKTNHPSKGLLSLRGSLEPPPPEPGK